jgi:hypothetical protein
VYINSADKFGVAAEEVITCNFLRFVKKWYFIKYFNSAETNNTVRIPLPYLKWKTFLNEIQKYISNQQTHFNIYDVF